ncbi:putative acyl--CoA ligase YhfT [Neobacillus rhizosphaerae]|uniref:Acyl--CoA ligase YhfT n=1 Tax=Neobacillus rhizosphaerae TaxID=2880965 RepID=A0ABM9EQU2_9BACI|nr:AMP-binding protein [Neobacillus rhizosphaerae]CAH2715010.1 putative acyl--CoA ligase YhfT [Neobacillus rhizosphaerae]
MPTITETYIKYAQLFPDKFAIETATEKISYRMWSNRVNQTANWLDSLKLSNQTLGILLPNGISFLQLFTGAATAGWTSVLFDLKWTESELQNQLTLSLPSIIITTSELYPKVKHLHPAVLLWEDCLQETKQASINRSTVAEGNLPFYMGFTSGTTGQPKSFIRSHNSWVASFDCSRVDFQMNADDHVVIPGALIHSHFLYGAVSTLYLGGSLYLLEKFSPSKTLSLIESQSITAVYVVPTMIAALLAEGRSSDKPIKILSSGAKWEEHSKQQIQRMFPRFSMYEFYGASELSFVTVLADKDYTRKPGSVGRPCHQVEIEIRRSNSKLAQLNEPGKIFVKSKMVFLGYLDKSEAGEHTGHRRIHSIQDENGWITVGDIGYLDEDGFLYLSGREKNMILYGAINIFPEEIEKVISAHPYVEEVVVIGIDDPYWGQVAAAVVKGTASKMELKRFCRQHLSSYKIPRHWFFIKEMPYTTSGKIARPQVKEYIESKVTNH